MKTEAEIKEKISYLEGYVAGINFIDSKEFKEDKISQTYRVYDQISALKWVLSEIEEMTCMGK